MLQKKSDSRHTGDEGNNYCLTWKEIMYALALSFLAGFVTWQIGVAIVTQQAINERLGEQAAIESAESELSVDTNSPYGGSFTTKIMEEPEFLVSEELRMRENAGPK